MDKFEMNLKIDQIKKLAAKKDYKEAAKIAKEMNWTKVKDWQSLATVINVQEAVGDYEEARDMAILAYNRNLGGRKLVYKLTEYFIKVGDFDNANELYREYERASMHDVNRFILYFNLRRAEKASENELIEILEEYKEHEIDEKYMYELAKLYYKTGRNDECISTCDNIVLLFQDGVYVERAIQIKERLNAGITSAQRKILDNAKKQKQDKEATKELLFEQQKELARLKMDDVEQAFIDDENVDIFNVSSEVAVSEEEAEEEAIFESLTSDEEPKSDNNEESEDSTEAETGVDEGQLVFASIEKPVVKEARTISVPGFEEEKGPLSMDLVQNEQNDEIKEFVMKAIHGNHKKPDKGNTGPVNFVAAESPKIEAPKLDITTSEEGAANMKSGIDKASLSLKELIENAKQKNESNYEMIKKQDEEEQRKEIQARIDEKADNMEISIPAYSMYDTQNLSAEIAVNLKELFNDDNLDNDAGVLSPKKMDTSPVDKEALRKLEHEGDENNEDDEQIEGQLNIADWMQSVKEEKYGKQDTKEFSKAELTKYLDDKDEKSAAYEKLLAQKKMEAKNEGSQVNEEEVKRAALAQVVLSEVKTDLAIRTGKASARLEQAAKEYESIVVPLVTAQIPTISDEMKSNVEQLYNEEKEEQIAKMFEENLANESAATEEAATQVSSSMTNTRRVKKSQIADDGNGKRLRGDLAKVFRKYREMPGLESQLVELFEGLDEEMEFDNSVVGNILISGNSSSDKTDLAKTIVRAINTIYPDKQKKIAKTTGESINQRGITKAMSKLRGTALIVEGAGTIQPKRINEILNCLEQDTDRMIVIFEDSDAEMKVLLNFNPELENAFNHKIILKQYTVNELVEMAKRFARKRQYEVDDDALLELYLKIDKMHSINDNIKLDDIKEIINQAILNSERRASRKFFGGLRKKRSDNGDVIFLTEADFKDIN